MNSPSQRIWGYETPDGSFSQFTRVQSQQLMPRPKHLTWEESACYTLTLATAYRMLFGHEPHDLKPGQNVLAAAFGPVGRHWEPRVRYAGTYDDRWTEDRMPLLPKDFDDRFHNAAPPGLVEGFRFRSLAREGAEAEVAGFLNMIP